MGPLILFVLHLLERSPEMFDRELRAQLEAATARGSEAKKKREAKGVLLKWRSEFQEKKRGPPLDWTQVTGDVLKRYFANLKGTRGELKGKAAGKSTKSTAAVLHLFSMFGQSLSSEASAALTGLWKGMKRDFQDLKASGQVSIHEGKRAIPMHLFEALLSACRNQRGQRVSFATLTQLCLSI